MSALIIFGLLTVLMLTGMPISISLGLTVLTFLFTMTQVPIEAVAMKLFTGIEKFEIMAIPFFILAGNFLTHGGVAKRMINFATAIVGHLRGGLALGGVLACALFAAVSGSSPATVVAIGSILLPAMVKQGYPMKFGVGVIGTAGGLGLMTAGPDETTGFFTPPDLAGVGVSGISSNSLSSATSASVSSITGSLSGSGAGAGLAGAVLLSNAPISSSIESSCVSSAEGAAAGAGIITVLRHPGHNAFLPALLSGAFTERLHLGHENLIPISAGLFLIFN